MSRDLVLITGASSELGRELVSRLARSGGDGRIILAHYFNNRDAIPTERGIIPLQADFSHAEAVQKLAECILSDFGSPDKIVHLPAERLRYERFAKFDAARFDRDFAIQFRSIVTLLSAFLPVSVQTRKKPEGDRRPNAKVVFALSSALLGAPPKFMSAYTATKYAMWGLMRALAAEYADSRVNVNAVSPSMIETQFLASIPAKAIEFAAASNPAGRNATTRDIVPAIEFLLSPESDYMNGANIPITGGSAF
jgi:3-oxoacyl-[acyl-carrier protein] reductase